jgi:hypothetical protein
MAANADKLKKTHPGLYAEVYRRGFDAGKAEAAAPAAKPSPLPVQVTGVQAEVNRQLQITDQEFNQYANAR